MATFPIIKDPPLIAYKRVKKPDDFGYVEPENVDTKKFLYTFNVNIKDGYSASWKKTGIYAQAEKGGIHIWGTLLEDCEDYTWRINKKVPSGEKVLAINITKALGKYTWGNKLFSVIINGKPVQPINYPTEGSDNDPYIVQTTGIVYYNISDDLTELKTIEIKTASGSNIDIQIEDIKVYAKQDLKTETENILPMLLVNQLGYTKNGNKTATITLNQKLEPNQYVFYKIVNTRTKKTLLCGKVTEFSYFKGSGNYTAQIDFSNIKTPGEYQIVVSLSNKPDQDFFSPKFIIKNNYSELFSDLRNSALETYTYLTCGKTGPYKCHEQDEHAVKLGTQDEHDVRGGWHDAGDYGKYIVNGGYSTGLMLTAYEYYPESFKYDIGTVPLESKQRPDYLSQIKTELDWMLTMQNPDGSVNHKVCSGSWPGSEISPENDNKNKNIIPVSTTATADYAAVLAKASIIYSKTDPNQAKLYLEKAESAWDFLEKNPNLIMVKEKYNDLEYGGPYTDKDDGDERLWAAVELWKATKKEKYLTYINKNLDKALDSLETGDWENVNFISLFSLYQKTNKNNQEKILAWTKKYAENIIELQSKNPYGVPIENDRLEWGSNSVITTTALNMLLAYKITGDRNYADSALKCVDYLLGNNPLQKSFIIGYGENSVKDPHYRPYMSGKYPLPKGFLAGGPNNVDIGGDGLLAGEWEKPGYLHYIDNKNSWATNEIAINWNAGLVALISILCSLEK